MTVAADSFARPRGELARWGGSLLLVALLHAGAALYLLSRQMPLDAGGPPPAAVMIDLAPLPAPEPPQPLPPEPVVQPQPRPQAEPAPPPPEVPQPAVEPSPAPKPVVALPPKPPRRPPPKHVERPAEARPEQPPPAAAAPPAPATAPPAVNAGAARASWQARLVGWLERYKRYPRLAQEQRQEGTVYLRFTMDRGGRVLASRIEKGSGHSLLDDEVAALIQRAQPLPAPPPEITGAQITLTLPVQFFLRGGAR